MTQTKLTLIRHGQTDWNMRGLWQGHAPIPLNTTGFAQAQGAAPHLQNAGIDRIMSSDLLRATQTADAINAMLSLPISYDRRWREVDLGNWQGLTNGEIKEWDSDRRAAFSAADYLERQFPDGESTRQHIARTAEAMNEAVRQHPGEHLLTVTHGGSVRCAVYYITGEAIHLSGNCSITRFTYDTDTDAWSVQGIAEDAGAVVW